ncbi:MAG: hypothetical protein ABI780_07170, partial [Ardenticatenales bacterium]
MLGAFGLLAFVNSSDARGQASDPRPLGQADHAVGFIPNGGQWDEAVRYHVAPGGVEVWLTSDGYTLAAEDNGQLPGEELSGDPADESTPANAGADSPTIARHSVKIAFDGAEEPTLEATGPLPGSYNWLIGPESDWATDLAAFRAVTYRGVWKGIDAKVTVGSGASAAGKADDTNAVADETETIAKWQYSVEAGANPADIKLRYSGQDSLAVVGGNLVVGTQLGDLTETGLVAWQDAGFGDRHYVDVSFTLDGDVVGFGVGAYDATLPLTIDPIVGWSRRFGGTSTDAPSNISIGTAGNIYTSGWSASTDYPTLGGYQAATAGSYDCIVTKTNADNSALVYSTYLGGNSTEYDCRSTLTPANEVIISAISFSTTWVGAPFTIGTPSVTPVVGIAILNAAGNGIVASARAGGTSTDYAHGVARMSNGNIVVTGETFSTTGWPALGGARPALIGSPDGFALVLNSSLSAATAFSYFGGNSSDYGNAVAVDASNNVYVQYSTISTDQTLIGTGPGGNYDVGVVKFNSALTSIGYNVRFGGASTEPTAGASDTSFPNPFYQASNTMIVVDGSGQAWVTGMSASTDYPTTAGAYQTANGGNYDVFVTQLNAGGTAILKSTFIGGTSTDAGRAIALDAAGRVYVVGSTCSSNYPTTPGEVQTTNAACYDYVRSIFSADLKSLVCSTYYGGNSTDYGADIEVLGNYKTIINGASASANFP